jgi:hypothetical protein
MKRIILIAIVTNLSLAQLVAQKSNHFGVKVGLNLVSTTDCSNVDVSGYANKVIQFSVGWLF